MTREVVAIHEASHAVVSMTKGYACAIVTIEPGRDGELGHWRPPGGLGTADSGDLIVILLAGPIAEAKLTGRPARGASSDYERARILAAVRAKGEELDAPAVNALLARYTLLAAAAVECNWPSIVRVAKALERRRTMTGDQVADYM